MYIFYYIRKLENYALWQMCREGRKRKIPLLPSAPVPCKLSVLLAPAFCEMPCFFIRDPFFLHRAQWRHIFM